MSSRLRDPADLPLGKSERIKFNRMFGGPLCCSGHSREQKNLSLTGFELSFLGYPARSVVTILNDFDVKVTVHRDILTFR